MKKRVMLAMAIVMLLGSVKAMASAYDENQRTKTEASEEDSIMSSDDMLMNDAMIENQISKTQTAEAELAKAEKLGEIREKIMVLAEKSKFLDEVKVGSQTVSRGQALFAAEADYTSLENKFDMKHAKDVSSILDASIQSLPKSK
ncbi:hypothetical protein DOM22_01990 [Bdellovibrio sp. ZAP7]|uniref:hypothetical protein n=1 Tax=Bdellovibrio sp. ZAP7 TaxID=2231053 RepID=UPI0011593A16|nr:hypothetical protein [Bdellovibrio sp. ZAP7]QDK44017.1 hypothetical protein DOM22_01990 [Bdellovibrio sp. ZAP7]